MYFMLEISVQELTLPKRNRLYYLILIPALCCISGRLPAAQPDDITLGNEYWSVRISPGTLEMSAEPAGGAKFPLSKGSYSPGSERVGNINEGWNGENPDFHAGC